MYCLFAKKLKINETIYKENYIKKNNNFFRLIYIFNNNIL